MVQTVELLALRGYIDFTYAGRFVYVCRSIR
jgi:hypothetical protein